MSEPEIVITEQPASVIRFRYDSENQSKGGNLLGAKSTDYRKSFPSIELRNHNGPAIVMVSCVTKDPPYKPHPYKIVGKNSLVADGVCCFKVPPEYSPITFANLGIQCVRRNQSAQSLLDRQRRRIDPFGTGFEHIKSVHKMDINCVRLCFQAFVESREGVFNRALKPLVSQPIYDKKHATDLTVSWLSHCAGSTRGGQRVCILCEKVTKGDVEVTFYNPRNQWSAIAKFFPPEVHEHVALVVLTPEYDAEEIDEPVQVELRLKQKSDPRVCSVVEFVYYPEAVEQEDGLKLKRMRLSRQNQQQQQLNACPSRTLDKTLQVGKEAAPAVGRAAVDADMAAYDRMKDRRARKKLLVPMDVARVPTGAIAPPARPRDPLQEQTMPTTAANKNRCDFFNDASPLNALPATPVPFDNWAPTAGWCPQPEPQLQQQQQQQNVTYSANVGFQFYNDGHSNTNNNNNNNNQNAYNDPRQCWNANVQQLAVNDYNHCNSLQPAAYVNYDSINFGNVNFANCQQINFPSDICDQFDPLRENQRIPDNLSAQHHAASYAHDLLEIV